MSKSLHTAFAFVVLTALLGLSVVSCSDTETYADLVNSERRYIARFTDGQGIRIAARWDEEKVNDVTSKILNDSICPDQFVELGKWYEVTEGDFKRLCFMVKSWGNGYPDMRSRKFYTGSNALVRYDSCYVLNTFKDFATGKADNLDPNSYEIIYSWRPGYFADTYDSYYYGGAVNSYQCTSGGMAFPMRLLWEGGEAAVIVPFGLGTSMDQTYYMTTYYGSIRYLRPNYLPE